MFKKLNKALFLSSLIFNSFLFSIKITPELINKLQSIVLNSKCHTGIEIYSSLEKRIIYEKNAEKLFTPASTTKLFLALSALHILGSNYKFETTFLTDGQISNNCLKGNLFIKGSGDPTLKTEDFNNLIKILLDNNIEQITGDICIDTTIFDNNFYAPGTTTDDIGANWNNTVGGLIIDHKAASINSLPNIELFDHNRIKDIFFNISDFLKNLLEKNNIRLEGKVVYLQAPENNWYVLGTHKSEKLSFLLKHMLKVSDNLYADCIFKKLGNKIFNEPGSWQNGKRALDNFLKENLFLESNQIKIVDGSGLSRYNLISPDQAIKLLIWAHGQCYFAKFLKSLPISAIDGTLEKRMSEIPGKVKAKTATMGGVSALSGYIESDDDTLIFSILNNGYIQQTCKLEIEDAICKILVNAD